MKEVELNRKLAMLLGDFIEVPNGLATEIVGNVENIIHLDRSYEACYIDYCNDWSELMEVALEHGVYFKPLAWERTGKFYRAYYMSPDKEGRMTNYGTRYYSDHEFPEIAIVQTLIKVLEDKKGEER